MTQTNGEVHAGDRWKEITILIVVEINLIALVMVPINGRIPEGVSTRKEAEKEISIDKVIFKGTDLILMEEDFKNIREMLEFSGLLIVRDSAGDDKASAKTLTLINFVIQTLGGVVEILGVNSNRGRLAYNIGWTLDLTTDQTNVL